MCDFFCINTSTSAHCSQSLKSYYWKNYTIPKQTKMALFEKLVALMLLAYASALPKIQHRADGNSNGYDISQYFNSEKFQQYLKENPSALNNYFNIPGQSSSSNTNDVQSDSMLEDQQGQQGYFQQPNWQEYMTACMGQSFSPAASSNSGSKAEEKANSNPFEQYYSQYTSGQSSFSQFTQQQEQWKKCSEKFQQTSLNYSPSSNFQGFNSPNWQSFLPSSNNAQSSSS